MTTQHLYDNSAPSRHASDSAVRLSVAPATTADDQSAVRHAVLRHEMLFFIVGYLGYLLAKAWAADGVAPHNARTIWHIEQWLHLDIEPFLNRALHSSPVLASVASYYYVSLNLVVTATILIWLYRRRPEIYPQLRTMFGVTTLVSVVFFWMIPVAPPRTVITGMSDTVLSSEGVGSAYQGGMGVFANMHAAMPSLHVAWAVWCTVAIFQVSQRRWLRIIAVAYPMLTTLDILATANHFVMDVFGGALVLVAGYAVATRKGKRRQLQADHEAIDTALPSRA